jgi:hypothetical protein
MPEDKKELLRRRIRAALDRADEAFEGKYSDELERLLGLSRVDLRRVAPDTGSMEDYNRLISVVREASRVNASQAALASHIRSLGDTAVRIAGLVPGLSGVLKLV